MQKRIPVTGAGFRIEKLEERIAPAPGKGIDHGNGQECHINPQGKGNKWCYSW